MALALGAVPIRWMCGLLDAAQSEGKPGFSAESRQLLEKWLDPALLDLLRGTPINCLVVNWEEDAAQQKVIAPLIQRAKELGLTVCGLSATPSPGIETITPAEWTKLGWTSGDLVLAARGCVWPAAQGASTSAGPTGSPWIDSNAWLCRLWHLRAAGKVLWLLFEPPAPGNIVRPEAYVRAIADGALWGARWVVSLDQSLRAGLAQGKSDSMETWKTITRAVSFFDKHREWTTWEPQGVLGVISDFAGVNESSSSEILNLLGRLNVPYRIIEYSKVALTDFSGYRALVAMDAELPGPALRRELLTFVHEGGVLMVGASWKGQSGSDLPHPRVEVRAQGKGKLVVSKSDSPDPFLVARDAYAMMGRVHDPIRFFNISAFLSSYQATPGGSRAVIQLINHASRSQGELVTVWCRRKYRSAKLWTIGADNAAEVPVRSENNGVSLDLPAVPSYAAVEVTG